MRKQRQLSVIVCIVLLTVGISLGCWGQSSPYEVKIGDIKVTALTDGTVPINVEQLFAQGTPDNLQQLLDQSFLKNPVEISINVYLLQYDTKRILIDVGSGELFGKYGGKLTESLSQVGVKPEDITDILLTHVHDDHSGGLVVAGKKVFPNAIIHVHQAEIDFWLNAKNKKPVDKLQVGAASERFAAAENMLEPYLKSKQLLTFSKKTDELLPYITAIPFAGHTPGHTVYLLSNKNEKLYFCGDLVHIGGMQFKQPFLADYFDVDIHGGAVKRKEFYESVALNKYLIAGPHISFPGMGHLKKVGQEYLWIPVPFSLEDRTE